MLITLMWLWCFYHSGEEVENEDSMSKTPVYNKKITPGCWCVSYFNLPQTYNTCRSILTAQQALSYSTCFMFCRACFCSKCDGWFSDKESTGTSTECGRENALHSGGICPTPDEIQTTQYRWGNPAGLLWRAWDSPRTYRYCPVHIRPQWFREQRLLQNA